MRQRTGARPRGRRAARRTASPRTRRRSWSTAAAAAPRPGRQERPWAPRRPHAVRDPAASLRLNRRPWRRTPRELPIARPRPVDGTVERQPPVVQDRRPGAQVASRLERMRHEDECHTGLPELLDPLLALLLEPLVPDRQHLVDDEDVGLDVLCDGEAE